MPDWRSDVFRPKLTQYCGPARLSGRGLLALSRVLETMTPHETARRVREKLTGVYAYLEPQQTSQAFILHESAACSRVQGTVFFISSADMGFAANLRGYYPCQVCWRD
jgi:hypothetical protein